VAEELIATNIWSATVRGDSLATISADNEHYRRATLSAEIVASIVKV
jgi:hypothetical protein